MWKFILHDRWSEITADVSIKWKTPQKKFLCINFIEKGPDNVKLVTSASGFCENHYLDKQKDLMNRCQILFFTLGEFKRIKWLLFHLKTIGFLMI